MSFYKYDLPIFADNYINLYNGCNIGCKFCKFNPKKSIPVKQKIDCDKYHNQKILISYSVEPLQETNNTFIKEIINELHNNNCKIIVLSRMPKRLTNLLPIFLKNDFIGISISEEYENDFESIDNLLKKVKDLKLNSWISLEPVLSFEFAEKIIEKYINNASYIRIGKDDNLTNYWNSIYKKLTEKYKYTKKIIIKK